jgi:hypothetical protein
MTDKKPKAKSKPSAVAKGASCAASRELKQHTKLEGGLPIFSIGLDDLAHCDPKAGLKPLLKSRRDAVFFPVSIHGTGAFSLTMVKEGRVWKRTEINFGPLARSVPEAVRRHQVGAGTTEFRLVYIPAISHTCVAFENEDGEHLVVLERWPSDAKELATLTKVEPVLAILKEQALKHFSSSIVTG